MSVNFHSDLTDEATTSKEAPCLCSQMAERWLDAMDGDFSEAVRADLKANANPACPMCHGTGVEMEEESDAPHFNLANDNAGLLFEALGLGASPYGDLSVPEARRAVMRARSRSDLSPFTRETEVLHGRPRADENGVVNLRPMRLHSAGVDEAKMASYIDRFSAFVEASASRGATTISWD